MPLEGSRVPGVKLSALISFFASPTNQVTEEEEPEPQSQQVPFYTFSFNLVNQSGSLSVLLLSPGLFHETGVGTGLCPETRTAETALFPETRPVSAQDPSHGRGGKCPCPADVKKCLFQVLLSSACCLFSSRSRSNERK